MTPWLPITEPLLPAFVESLCLAHPEVAIFKSSIISSSTPELLVKVAPSTVPHVFPVHGSSSVPHVSPSWSRSGSTASIGHHHAPAETAPTEDFSEGMRRKEVYRWSSEPTTRNRHTHEVSSVRKASSSSSSLS